MCAKVEFSLSLHIDLPTMLHLECRIGHIFFFSLLLSALGLSKLNTQHVGHLTLVCLTVHFSSKNFFIFIGKMGSLTSMSSLDVILHLKKGKVESL